MQVTAFLSSFLIPKPTLTQMNQCIWHTTVTISPIHVLLESEKQTKYFQKEDALSVYPCTSHALSTVNQ